MPSAWNNQYGESVWPQGVCTISQASLVQFLGPHTPGSSSGLTLGLPGSTMSSAVFEFQKSYRDGKKELRSKESQIMAWAVLFCWILRMPWVSWWSYSQAWIDSNSVPYKLWSFKRQTGNFLPSVSYNCINRTLFYNSGLQHKDLKDL